MPENQVSNPAINSVIRGLIVQLRPDRMHATTPIARRDAIFKRNAFAAFDRHCKSLRAMDAQTALQQTQRRSHRRHRHRHVSNVGRRRLLLTHKSNGHGVRKKCDENARALFAFFIRPMQACLRTAIYFFYFRRQGILIFCVPCRRLLQLLIFTCLLQTTDCIKDTDRAFHALATHEYMPR